VRVVLDASIQVGDEPTGVERAQATLIRALAALDGGPELILAAPRPVGPELAAAGSRTHHPSRALPTAVWRETALPRLLRETRADLLHSPVAAVPLRAPCPVIATLHELPWATVGGSTGRRGLRDRARTALAARLASGLVCVSERTRDDLLAIHPGCAARVRVVPNAVDPRFSPGTADARGPQAWPLVLAVGRLRRKKNLGTLLEAFARCGEAAGHRLVLAGPGGDAAAALRARARRPDLRGRVVFTGFVSDERLVGLYRSASCVVFPSLFEGFGLPVLEAMACGAPVVASRQGAAAEVRGEAVRPCDARDPLSLARGLGAVLGDRDVAAELTRRGLAHAACFGATAAARRIAALYEECRSEYAA
jgi:glycosyltransferase involved in cell wall biosynthesis